MIDIDEGFHRGTSLPTAGAISVPNAKGQLVTQKVKVRRYAAGKLPAYADKLQASDDEEDDFDSEKLTNETKAPAVTRNEQEDRRLRRLQERELQKDDNDDDERDRIRRHRRIVEPEVLGQSSDEEEDEEEQEQERERDEDDEDKMDIEDQPTTSGGNRLKMDIEPSDDDDEDMDEDAIERRRQRLKLKAKQREEELLQIEDEKEIEQEEAEPSEESESEEEEEEEEDEDEGLPRLKPVFVRKDDRRTVAEREAEERRQKELEIEKKRLADERRMHTHKLVEEAIREEKQKEKEADDGIHCDFNTDDEDADAAYDAWKLRELKRLKRDREERDQREREKQEIERWHNMTEEERAAEAKRNPKFVDNKAPKGKYKFLQKYYHRGAFFMDKDDEIYKRDFAAPTLEDHFDKQILPKVMQVKNFGMAGRTKYTHLLDQDTTVQAKSPWVSDKEATMKFHKKHGGGMKEVFDRPKLKKTEKKTH